MLQKAKPGRSRPRSGPAAGRAGSRQAEALGKSPIVPVDEKGKGASVSAVVVRIPEQLLQLQNDSGNTSRGRL